MRNLGCCKGGDSRARKPRGQATSGEECRTYDPLVDLQAAQDGWRVGTRKGKVVRGWMGSQALQVTLKSWDFLLVGTEPQKRWL